MAQIAIHLQRIGKPARLFMEELIADDGVQVQTFTRLPEAVSASLSAQFCRQGKIPPGSRIHSAAKYLFYTETYSIVAFRDAEGKLLGCYCDIVTPLQKSADGYTITDLILDLWIAPDGAVQVLDETEFQAAVQSGLIPTKLAEIARTTLEQLTQGCKILQICSTIANLHI